jgi:hypothetical protein
MGVGGAGGEQKGGREMKVCKMDELEGVRKEVTAARCKEEEEMRHGAD